MTTASGGHLLSLPVPRSIQLDRETTFMAVTETTRLAVLIDADNASASVVKELGLRGCGLASHADGYARHDQAKSRSVIKLWRIPQHQH